MSGRAATQVDLNASERISHDLDVSVNLLSCSQLPPDLTHIEGRAVSAAFLRKFAREKVTEEIEQRATEAAIPYLEERIEWWERQLKKQEENVVSVGHQRQTNATRWLGWLREDLEKRKTKAYMTARDVHRYIIKTETDELQCRYCELPGLAEQKDPETDTYYFGLAEHFFSYNWDSPFEDVVDAICTHSQAEVAAGKAAPYYWLDNFAINQHERTSEDATVRARDSPDSHDIWRMSSVACPPCVVCAEKNAWEVCRHCPCAACSARANDLPSWECIDGPELLGFERVIRHTRSTLLLMEPWHRPRAPTRVWCLFEANCTLRHHGRLRAVLGSVQVCDLRLNLSKKFADLEDIVSSLDSRNADASGEEDRHRIFAAIERLPGGHDELDKNIQAALRRWLAQSAEGVIERTNPRRLPLDSIAMAQEAAQSGKGGWLQLSLDFCCIPYGAKATWLLERFPRLLGVLMLMATLLLSVVFFLLSLLWYTTEVDSSDDLSISTSSSDLMATEAGHTSLLWIAVILCPIQLWLCVLWAKLTEHQRDRHLRTRPVFGDCSTRNPLNIMCTNITLSCILVLVMYYMFGWRLALCSLVVGFMWFIGLIVVLQSDADTVAIRATLASQAGWLWLSLGESDAALAIFAPVHLEVQRTVGIDDPTTSWVVAMGYARALCDAGRQEDVDNLRAELDNVWSVATQFGLPKIANWCLERARMAVAARVHDTEVLELLMETSQIHKFPIPAGSRLVDNNGGTEGKLPEWEDFFERMAHGGCGQWEAYRTIAIENMREWAQEVDVGHALESRHLHAKVEGESKQERRGRLVADFFTHRCWEYTE